MLQAVCPVQYTRVCGRVTQPRIDLCEIISLFHWQTTAENISYRLFPATPGGKATMLYRSYS